MAKRLKDRHLVTLIFLSSSMRGWPEEEGQLQLSSDIMSRVQLMLSWLQQSDRPPVRAEDPAGQDRSEDQGRY